VEEKVALPTSLGVANDVALRTNVSTYNVFTRFRVWSCMAGLNSP
jgi:hypothetical protein